MISCGVEASKRRDDDEPRLGILVALTRTLPTAVAESRGKRRRDCIPTEEQIIAAVENNGFNS